MTVPIYCVALVIALFMGWNADRTRQKAFHVIAACAWGVVSFVICVTVKSIPVRYTFICFGGAGVWSAVPLFLSWMVTMFDGREKRAVCIALINGVGNCIYPRFRSRQGCPADENSGQHLRLLLLARHRRTAIRQGIRHYQRLYGLRYARQHLQPVQVRRQGHQAGVGEPKGGLQEVVQRDFVISHTVGGVRHILCRWSVWPLWRMHLVPVRDALGRVAVAKFQDTTGDAAQHPPRNPGAAPKGP